MGKHCMIAVMTMLVVLGLVYEIGEQGIRYQVKPLYKVYEEDGEMKERIEETKELLFEEEKIVNWYVAGNSKWNYGEQWDNLIDFAEYFGYELQKDGVRSVVRNVKLSSELIKGKKGKKKDNNEQKSMKEKLQESINEIVEMPITTQIKSRISAFAKKVNKRMRNRKQQSTSKKSRKNKKDKGQSDTILTTITNWLFYPINHLKQKIMTDINTKKLWIIYVDNDEDHDGNIKYLTRALVKIIKLYPEDQILLLSRHVLEIDQDRLEKFVSIMEISIDKRVLWRLKSSLFGEISQRLNLETDGQCARFVCSLKVSLRRINNYLQRCMYTGKCIADMHELEQSSLKRVGKQHKISLVTILRQICAKGQADYHVAGRHVSHMFGFLKLGQDWSESKYPYLTWRRNQTRLGYETVNQVLCRGTEQCDGEWLLKGQDLEDKEDNEKKGKKGDNHEKGNSGKDKSERQKTHQQEVKENGQKNNEETMKESSQHKDNKSKQQHNNISQLRDSSNYNTYSTSTEPINENILQKMNQSQQQSSLPAQQTIISQSNQL